MQKKIDPKDELMAIWNSFISGNDSAFPILYNSLIAHMFSYGSTLTADSELVKDCIQDVFIKLYQNKAQLAWVKNIKIYILVALKNAIIDAFRKNQTYQKFIDTYDNMEEPIEESPEEKIILQETETELRNLTTLYKSVLTPRQQEIIHYRFVEELSIEEISNILKINYQSVANSIQKSLHKIRKIYCHKVKK